MSRKRNHQPRIHRHNNGIAQPSFLLLGLMEHAGISKPWYQRKNFTGYEPLFAPIFAPIFDGWIQRAGAKLKGAVL